MAIFGSALLESSHLADTALAALGIFLSLRKGRCMSSSKLGIKGFLVSHVSTLLFLTSKQGRDRKGFTFIRLET